MKKFRIIVLIAALIVFTALTAVAVVACKDDKKTAEYTETDLFWRSASHSSVVYAIKTSGLTVPETEMVVSLQGIVAKESAAIFVDSDEESEDWLEYAAEKYGFITRYVADPWELLDMFASSIDGEKYVLYNSHGDEDTNIFDQTVNYATTVSGAERWLMIPASLEEDAIEHGLTLGKDVRGSNTADIFNEYKDRLTKKLLIHQSPLKWELRDYAIAASAMCFYSDYYDGSDVKDDILSWADENVPILGWTENEVNFVESNSIHSKITVAADWSSNLSLYSSFDQQETYEQINYECKTPETENKHYVAIVMSDGDNLQWMDNGFATDSKYYGSQYRGDFPMTWTMAPSMTDLAPHILSYLYENASSNDEFIAGPSGVGYVNATHYNSDALAGYAALTASYMKETGLSYLNLLDSNVDRNVLGEFAKYDCIKGGVWSVGEKYIEGEGGVYWAEDKPFVCVRETLWRIAGDDVSNSYYGFVERVAQRINNYKVDPYSIEGYTVVVAHAWSIGTMDYVSRFVEALDEDVEVVTLGQLLNLVTENVEHKDVAYPDDIRPEDITDLVPISSEQYRVAQIDALATDSRKSFEFDGGETGSYGWQFGNGGMQYDSAGYAQEGIKLDGSDLNDVIDPMPNAWAVNKISVGEEDLYLRLFASISSDSDVNMRIRFLWTENGELRYKVLESADYGKELDEYGWYRFDGDSPLVYVYDISEFAGKTVAVSIEQDDTGDGSGEILFVSRFEIYGSDDQSGTEQSWDVSDIAAYWKKSGEVARHAEGICLEGENAMIYNTVTVASDVLCISMLKFKRPNYQGQDVTGFAAVRINGNYVRPVDGVTDYVEVGNTSENFFYKFDVSGYRGQTVNVEIISIAVNGVAGEHVCIRQIAFG
ncbi:MAG TPA: hypothetical protein IAB11_02920 [Candidatus Ornithoclostridium faecavium]|nr:hypothetical protein [Candidatus Ornithoclostridium faecavium]